MGFGALLKNTLKAGLSTYLVMPTSPNGLIEYLFSDLFIAKNRPKIDVAADLFVKFWQ